MRWPVFLLIWLKLIFSESDVAGYKATGQVTRERRKKPFQLARGAILKTPPVLNRYNIGGGGPKWSRSERFSRNPGRYRRWTASPRRSLRCTLPRSYRKRGSAKLPRGLGS